jgi:putative 2-oxoglutarate-Fe(II)-dependent oxygenase superfamily protein
MAELHRYFATPVIIDELDDAANLNGELEAAILTRRAADPGLRLSNRGGWQSKRDFPEWAGDAGRALMEHAVNLANEHTVAARGTPMGWAVDAWANANESGHFNMPHVHGGTFWSVAYYVRVGEMSGGELVLHDPRMPGLRMHAPNLRFPPDPDSASGRPYDPVPRLVVAQRRAVGRQRDEAVDRNEHSGQANPGLALSAQAPVATPWRRV